jgi:hypothetical protein
MRVLALPDVAGNRLVVREIGKTLLAVQVGGAEVEPKATGD